MNDKFDIDDKVEKMIDTNLAIDLQKFKGNFLIKAAILTDFKSHQSILATVNPNYILELDFIQINDSLQEAYRQDCIHFENHYYYDMILPYF